MVEEHLSKGISGTNQQEVSADWEDAFQAEDFLVTPDTAPGTLFEDKAPSRAGTSPSTRRGLQGTVTKADDEGTVPSADGPVSKRRREMPPLLLTILESIGKQLSRLPLPRLSGSLDRRISLLTPQKRGIMLMAAVVLLFGVGGYFFLTGESGPVDEGGMVREQEVARAEKGAPLVSPATDNGNRGLMAEKQSGGPSGQATQEQVVMNGPDRHKWRFSSFMIDAGSDDEGKPSYVAIDVSLILHLDPGEDFPRDREYLIRNMIYQFFSNRPPYELKRFSLARGEMKQKLRAWFNKEWPGNRVESILFHRYQII